LSIDTLGVVVVPALAVLLYHFLPPPDEPQGDWSEPDRPPSEPVPKVETPPGREVISTRVAAPAAVIVTLVPLLAIGALGFVAVAMFSRRRH
jgi:hypothetical protein